MLYQLSYRTVVEMQLIAAKRKAKIRLGDVLKKCFVGEGAKCFTLGRDRGSTRHIRLLRRGTSAYNGVHAKLVTGTTVKPGTTAKPKSMLTLLLVSRRPRRNMELFAELMLLFQSSAMACKS